MRAKAYSARLNGEVSAYNDEGLYEFFRHDLNEKNKKTQDSSQLFLLSAVVLMSILVYSTATGSTGSKVGQTFDKIILSRANEFVRGIFSYDSPLEIHDDFIRGASNWTGEKESNWAVEAGRVRPAGLKLLQPSMALTDYSFEFEGQIDKKAISWAFRAPDISNYYASKIVVHRSTALPIAEVVSYAVLNGVESNRRRVPLPLSIRLETLYHVQLTIRGNQFITNVNGQIVDVWSDSRLKRGGVGFFNDKDESSVIHWMDLREEKEGVLSQYFSLGLFVNPATLYTIEH